MRKKVYCAAPYTKPDPVANTRKAVLAAQKLWDAGYAPYVPHLTLLFELVSSNPYETYLDMDMQWLEVCDYVVRLPGESSGADKEVIRAKELGIPVMTLEELLKEV